MTLTTHDPGGRLRWKLQDDVTGAARFSPCQRYRYWLSREWGARPDVVLFIGMNPSVGDVSIDDPTIRRELGFARSWGFDRYLKMNIMDYRSTDPKQLRLANSRSDHNQDRIVAYARRSKLVVAAWGDLPGQFLPFANLTRWALLDAGVKLYCLGKSKSGSPRHPLYLPKTSKLIEL